MPANPIPASLLDWYDRSARTLPWRTPPGTAERPDPYAVWLSEIMLQQTTVAAVIPYWQRFRSRWPDVGALAAAPDDAVMHEWAGLGYYARARNLLATARIVAARGGFPTSTQELAKLPGIGPYTAAAIAAIAFAQPVLMLDTNVLRVGARLFAVDQPLPGARPAIQAYMQPLVPSGRPGDFGQALMDLGATICTAATPDCQRCPLQPWCLAHQHGRAEELPRRLPRTARPRRFGSAWWIEHGGQVALVHRPATGLLGGMMGLPGTGWGATPVYELPFPANWQTMPTIRHAFTHFELHLALFAVRPAVRPQLDQPLIWQPRDRLDGLPSLYARAVRTILATMEPA